MSKERKKIFNKTNGHCYWCGEELKKGWHADHLDPVRRVSEIVEDESDSPYSHKRVFTGELENPEADNTENKVPSCPRCNIRRSTMDVETFREEIQAQPERLLRDSNQFRLAYDYGLVEIVDKDVEFYFERSKNCK